MRITWLRFGVASLFLAGGLCARAADMTVKVAEKPAPDSVHETIHSLLQNTAVQLVEDSKPVYEFWWVKEFKLPSKPAPPTSPFDGARPAALLGVISVSRTGRDYRDDDIPNGVYTLRYLLQPQDGNHLGTAEFPHFALLVPARLDTKPDAFTEARPLVRASSQGTATEHPLILSLRPLSLGEEVPLPALATPIPDHHSVAVELSARSQTEGEPFKIRFEVVYRGVGHK